MAESDDDDGASSAAKIHPLVIEAKAKKDAAALRLKVWEGYIRFAVWYGSGFAALGTGISEFLDPDLITAVIDPYRVGGAGMGMLVGSKILESMEIFFKAKSLSAS